MVVGRRSAVPRPQRLLRRGGRAPFRAFRRPCPRFRPGAGLRLLGLGAVGGLGLLEVGMGMVVLGQVPVVRDQERRRARLESIWLR